MPDSLFDAHYKRLEHPEALHAAFLDGSTKLADSVSDLKGTAQVKAWILHKLEQEFLKCTIEDKRVDDQLYRAEAARLMRDLLRRDDWITQPLVDVITLWSKVAQIEPIPADTVAVTFGRLFEAKAWLARVGDIALSDTGRPLVPVFEQSIADPAFSAQVISAFVQRIAELRTQIQIDALCFVEKEAGPIGLITAISNLVIGTGLPATIYREGYWSKRAQFTCYEPKTSDRMLIVYDLNVTGNGLRNVADRLYHRFGCQVSGAIVLMGYNKERQVIEFDSHQATVSAFEWYDDTLRRQVDQIRQTGTRETGQIRMLDDQPGAESLPERFGGETSPSTEEKEVDLPPNSSRFMHPPRNDAADFVYPYPLLTLFGVSIVALALGVVGSFTFRDVGLGALMVGSLLFLLSTECARYYQNRNKLTERGAGANVPIGRRRR